MQTILNFYKVSVKCLKQNQQNIENKKKQKIIAEINPELSDDYEELCERQIKQCLKQNQQNIENKKKQKIIAVINPELQYDYKELCERQIFLALDQKNSDIIATSLTEEDKLFNVENSDHTHQLLHMVHYAYHKHYPLSFSPDHIQLLITQGFCAHINVNAEKFRDKFVQHQGKKELQVKVPQMSIKQIQWSDVIQQIASLIKDNIGEERYKLCVHQYSTTDDVAQVCYAVSLMDAMQKYFKYSIGVACGISKVKLLGTLEDWIKVRESVEKLREFELDWWIDKIAPVLDQFIKLYKGEVDIKFWGDIYKYQQNRGIYDKNPSYATGWITYFFPYRVNENSHKDKLDFIKNDFSNKEEKYIKLIAKQIPTGISEPPVSIKNERGFTLMNALFYAGFIGVGLDQEGFLYSKLGWAITEGKLHF